MSTDTEVAINVGKRRFSHSNTTIVAVVLIVVTVLFAILTKGLLVSAASLRILAIFGPEMVMLTIGMGLVLLLGEMDLSVGSIYIVSSVTLAALYSQAGFPLWAATLAALVLGTCLGAINGLLVVTTGVTSFIVTLGTMWAFRGLMLVAVGGGTISVGTDYGKSGLLSWFGGELWGLPVQVLWLLIICTVLSFVRHRMRFGNWMQAVGSNDRAARMMGVPVGRVRVSTFMMTGFLSAFAGVVQVAHSSQAVPQSGDTVMLMALAGAVIGGVRLSGGRGDVLGPLLGGVTLQVISMGLVMMGIIEFWTQVLTAAAVIFTAFTFIKLDQLKVRRKS